MNRAWQVAKREFWVAVRKKGYIILTFGMPFFVLIYAGIVSIPGLLIHKKEQARRVIGVVDLAQVVKFEFAEQARSESIEGKEIAEKIISEKLGQPQNIQPQSKMIEEMLTGVEPVQYATEKDAEEALKQGKVFMYYVVPEDYIESGKVLSYTASSSFLSGKGKEGFMRKLLVMSMLSGRVEPKIQERVQKPLDLDEYMLEEGKFVKKDVFKEVSAFLIPILFCILLFMSIMMSSGFLLQGVAEEKESRVIEIILSSIKPDELLLGKIVGLGAVGLLQLMVWIGIGSIPLLLVFTMIEVKISTLVLAFPYYILGYLLFASLMAGIGSLGSNLKESQQLTMIITLPSIIPMVFFMLIIDEPNGILARILSYVPITAPATMITRLATGKVALWEVPITMIVLAVSIYFAVKIFGKVFRIGVLMYGKRPGFREIFRAARQA